MLRSVYSIVAGLAAACLVIFLAGQLGHFLSPLPGNLDLAGKLALAGKLYNAPLILYVVLLAGIALASFAGGFVAWLFSEEHHQRNALVVGCLLTAFGVANLVELPQAAWLWAGVAVCLPMAWIGARLPLSAQPPQQFA